MGAAESTVVGSTTAAKRMKVALGHLKVTEQVPPDLSGSSVASLEGKSQQDDTKTEAQGQTAAAHVPQGVTDAFSWHHFWATAVDQKAIFDAVSYEDVLDVCRAHSHNVAFLIVHLIRVIGGLNILALHSAHDAGAVVTAAAVLSRVLPPFLEWASQEALATAPRARTAASDEYGHDGAEEVTSSEDEDHEECPPSIATDLLWHNVVVLPRGHCAIVERDAPCSAGSGVGGVGESSLVGDGDDVQEDDDEGSDVKSASDGGGSEMLTIDGPVLARVLIDAVMKLTMCPFVTVPDECKVGIYWHPFDAVERDAALFVVERCNMHCRWAIGLGGQVAPLTTVTDDYIIGSRIMVLDLLVTIMSESLFVCPPGGSRVHGTGESVCRGHVVSAYTSPLFCDVVMFEHYNTLPFLCSLINVVCGYDPIGMGVMPRIGSFFSHFGCH